MESLKNEQRQNPNKCTENETKRKMPAREKNQDQDGNNRSGNMICRRREEHGRKMGRKSTVGEKDRGGISTGRL
jgi:hypothetical protein